MSKEKYIYQLMLDESDYRDSTSIANWVFCPYNDVFEIGDNERRAAIERLQQLLPSECFTVDWQTITYHGTTQACADDYSHQLIAHAYDVRMCGFSRSVLTSWEATNTLYFMADLFFVGKDKTSLLSLPQLLAYLERAEYGETTFTFGSITLVED